MELDELRRRVAALHTMDTSTQAFRDAFDTVWFEVCKRAERLHAIEAYHRQLAELSQTSQEGERSARRASLPARLAD